MTKSCKQLTKTNHAKLFRIAKDETTSTLKHLEHLAKVQDEFTVLEDEPLTKTEQITQSLTKNV